MPSLRCPPTPGPKDVSMEPLSGQENSPENTAGRSEEHTSELQSLMRNSYAVFCLKKNRHIHIQHIHHPPSTVHNHTSQQLTPSPAHCIHRLNEHHSAHQND